MKTLVLLGASLALFSTNTLSANWVFVGKGISTSKYIDIYSIRSGTPYSSVWELLDFTDESNGSKSMKIMFQADCTNKKIRMKKITSYTKNMGEGEEVNTSYDANWESESKFSIEYYAICNAGGPLTN